MPSPNPPTHTLTSSHLYDALILGSGPAGLSAALALSRVNRTAAIFSTPTFRNSPAHRAHNVLGHDHIPPSEIRAKGRKDVEKYGTTKFIERTVASARKAESEGIFEVVDESGERWRGKRVVLASGVRDVYPEIEGYAECWGGDIYQCLFCDGLERSDRPTGTLGFAGPMTLHNIATMLQQGSPSVTIYSNGPQEVTEKTGPALEKAKALGAKVDERKIARLVHLEDEQGLEIQFEDRSKTRLGFLSHVPPTVVNAPDILEGLGVEVVANFVGDGTCVRRSEPFGETNVKGVYAAGDLGAPMIKAVGLAMAQGAAAGAGVSMAVIGDELAKL